MKKVSMLSMVLVLITLAGCKKDKSNPPEPDTKAFLLGKWQLDKLINETYALLGGALVDSATEMGEAGDSCIFKSNNRLYSYEDKPGGIVNEEVYPFKFLNDSTISWDGEDYVIKRLTKTELYLHQEELDFQNAQKDVVKMYLVR
jgi:hypothetical protein